MLLSAGEEKTIKELLWTEKNNSALEAREERVLQVFRNKSSQVVEAPELVPGGWLPSGVGWREPGAWLSHPR